MKIFRFIHPKYKSFIGAARDMESFMDFILKLHDELSGNSSDGSDWIGNYVIEIVKRPMTVDFVVGDVTFW